MPVPSIFNDIGSVASSLTSGLGLLQGLGSLFGIGSGPSLEEQMAMQWEYSQKSMMQQFQNQLALQKDSQQYNTLAAKLANQYQQQLLKMQQQYQSGEWTRQFNMQNAYNSPAAMMKRMRSAGLNPSALIGGNMPSMAASTMGSQASAPSAPAAHMPSSGIGSAALQGVVPSFYDFALKRRESLNQIQQLARTAKELGYIDEQSMANIKHTWADIARVNKEANLNEALTNFKNVETELQRVHGHNRAKAEINHLLSQAYYNYCSGDYAKAQQSLSDLEKEMRGEQIRKLSIENSMLPASLRASIDSLHAAARKARAEAVESGERAKTERQTRDSKVGILVSEDTIKRNDAIISNLTRGENLTAAYAKLRADKTLSDEKRNRAEVMLQRIDQLKHDRSDASLRALDDALWYLKENCPSLIEFVGK